MENPVQLNIPITVSYTALESVLQQKLVGMYIPPTEDGTPTNPYAQVLYVGMTGSRGGQYNVQLRVQIRILRTILKRDNVDLYASVALAYDNTTQQVYVQQFSMESATSSGFYNTALEVLVNKVAYNQIIEKARIDVSEIVTKELEKINTQLAEGLELKGIKLQGTVNTVLVHDVTPTPEGLTLRLHAQANLQVAVNDLSGLMGVSDDEVV